VQINNIKYDDYVGWLIRKMELCKAERSFAVIYKKACHKLQKTFFRRNRFMKRAAEAK
jgi:hypothetical protein